VKRPAFRALACAALLAIASLVAVPSASAAVVSTYWGNAAAPNRCLAYGNELLGPYAQTCQFANYEKWIWNNDPSVWTPIRHEVTGKCLYARTNDLNVDARACDSTGDPYGRWAVNFPGNDGTKYAFIRNLAKPTLCLANTGASTVRLLTCNDNDGRVRWEQCPQCFGPSQREITE